MSTLVVFLEHFQLLRRRRMALLLLSFKYLHHPKLPVRDPQNSHLSFFGESVLHAFHVNFRILIAHAMSNVNRELEHVEPVLQELLTELRVRTSIHICFRRQVKENEDPHDAILIQADRL